MFSRLRLEPAAVIGALEAIVNAVQVAAIPLPTWAHTLIAVISIAAGSFAVRRAVTPVAKKPGPPASSPSGAATASMIGSVPPGGAAV